VLRGLSSLRSSQEENLQVPDKGLVKEKVFFTRVCLSH
jgi:hypothetical protein